MTSVPSPRRPGNRARAAFFELLKVQWHLALRQRYIFTGLALPTILLVVFWAIGQLNPGEVAGSGLTILELWTPTILVISYITIGTLGLPATFARDREIGWLRRVSTTPIPPSMLLAAQLLLNLIVAAVATVFLMFVTIAIFGAPLTVGVEFAGIALLAIVEMFSLGLVVAAIAPSQQAAEYIAGGFIFPLMFLSGLWVQPVQVGGALQTIMYYSPTGAAVRAILYSTFNATPPYTTIVTMVVYTVIFAFVAVRLFRWE